MTYLPMLREEQRFAMATFSAYRRAALSDRRRSSADEDEARRALGTDQHFPLATQAGASLERLARIALG